MQKLLFVALLALAGLAPEQTSAQTPVPDAQIKAQTPVPDAQIKANTPAAAARRAPVPAPPQMGARSYLLMDFNSGRVLVERDADQRLEMASITKLMTAYVVSEELQKGKLAMTDLVPVSETAWRTGGSRMFIEPGMEVTVEQLLMGVIIQSGNDASVALAEHLAGTEAAFAELMNHHAAELGMQETHFMNATGLPDPEHYSTARDIAKLSAAIIAGPPEHYGLYAQKEFVFNNIRQHNRNNLLWRDPAVDGLKTGHTEAAGYCLAATARRDGMRLISVVMGAASEQARADETQGLLNYGFRFFETLQLYRAGDELAQTPVWKGKEEQARLAIGQDLFVTIPRGSYDYLKATVDLPPTVIAPLEQGQTLGEVTVRLDEELIARHPLTVIEAVPEAGFFGRSWDGFKLWLEDEPEAPEAEDGEADGEDEEAEAADSDAAKTD